MTLLDAVTKMNANGTRKKMAVDQDRDGPADDTSHVLHQAVSPRLSHQVSGTTMTVTSTNSTTLPAVERPKKPAWYCL